VSSNEPISLGWFSLQLEDIELVQFGHSFDDFCAAVTRVSQFRATTKGWCALREGVAESDLDLYFQHAELVRAESMDLTRTKKIVLFPPTQLNMNSIESSGEVGHSFSSSSKKRGGGSGGGGGGTSSVVVPSTNVEVLYTFKVDWKGEFISVSTDLRDYKFLREIGNEYSGKMDEMLAWKTKQQHHAAAAFVGADNNNHGGFVEAPPAVQVTRVFLQNKKKHVVPFVMEPKLKILGDYTPSVEWLTNLLETDKNLLPKYAHEILTDNFDKLLFALQQLFHSIDDICVGID
jgi:hypothetical protein